MNSIEARANGDVYTVWNWEFERVDDGRHGASTGGSRGKAVVSRNGGAGADVRPEPECGCRVRRRKLNNL